MFCTMVRHGDETSGGHYTLYLEYLGGLIPLLKGKRASKLRPDFVIYDPKIKTTGRGRCHVCLFVCLFVVFVLIFLIGTYLINFNDFSQDIFLVVLN